MLIIGDRINGIRSRIARAIVERNEEFIIDLAKSQIASGTDFVDVNAGTS
jgi:cobalamin-dependent methionine synthase I